MKQLWSGRSGCSVTAAAIVALSCLALWAGEVHALDNGVARTPPMGWSSWLSFRFNVTSKALTESAEQMSQIGLVDAGYNYLLLDDGWPACAEFGSGDGHCVTPHPRSVKPMRAVLVN